MNTLNKNNQGQTEHVLVRNIQVDYKLKRCEVKCERDGHNKDSLSCP